MIEAATEVFSTVRTGCGKRGIMWWNEDVKKWVDESNIEGKAQYTRK